MQPGATRLAPSNESSPEASSSPARKCRRLKARTERWARLCEELSSHAAELEELRDELLPRAREAGERQAESDRRQKELDERETELENRSRALQAELHELNDRRRRIRARELELKSQAAHATDRHLPRLARLEQQANERLAAARVLDAELGAGDEALHAALEELRAACGESQSDSEPHPR